MTRNVRPILSRLSPYLLLVVLPLLLSACATAGNGDDDALECVTQADCASGASCLNNRCLRNAISDTSSDVPDTADTAPADSDAPDTAVEDTAADTEADADSSQDDSGAPDTAVEDSARPDTEPSDTGPDTSTADTGADTDDVATCGVFDAACARGTDCCSGLCVPNGVGATTGFCSDNCATFSDCNPVGRRGDFACLPVDDAGALRRVCLPNDFASRCDASTDCLGGICLRTAAASSCAWECRNSADCPDGTACGLLDFGGGDLRYTCAPVGNSCLTQNDCLSQTCLTPDTGGLGYCSLFCRTAGSDCPAGWRCSAVDPTLPALSVCALP